MGADLKRKEARKRKFSTFTSQTSRKRPKQIPAGPQALGNALAEQGNDASKATATGGFTGQGEAPRPSQKAQRFIVFIGSFSSYRHVAAGDLIGLLSTGNLPYTATDESISKHFARVQPKSVRHSKNRETGKSKGFAFLEFEGYDRMKTCLKLYHQLEFEDGISPLRKLNVELT